MMNSVCIRLMSEREPTRAKLVSGGPAASRGQRYVMPGDEITDDSSYMRGHGTYKTGPDDKQLVASIAGVVEPINRLISVRPLRTRYNGEIGDVVVGRITEVQQKKWKVETNSRLDSVLLLSSVNLPGGELRRKTTEDEMAMKNYLKEGDIIFAEVMQVFEDGALSLHTRNLKYGKLGQGVLVRVSPSLVERRKNHSHKLPIGVHLILGNNGFIWISRIISDGTESGGHVLDFSQVPLKERETIARTRNCILALAHHKVMLQDTSVLNAYEISLQLAYRPKDLLMPEVMQIISQSANQCLNQYEQMDYN